ncbi:MAG: hypothetical protein FK734_17370 [Asgard group archaeon]|nr:hypothetical protein [Asgard group archaeon]
MELSYWVIDSGVTSKEGRKCPKCGKLIPKSEKVCPSCAAKEKQNVGLREKALTEKDFECPKCKVINKAGEIICQSCGINFAEYEQNKPLDMSVLHQAEKKKRK